MIQIGLDSPNPKYIEIVNEILRSPYSLGMVGGKPAAALYFVGLHNDKYLYLDPHYVQPSTSSSNIDSLLETFFCPHIKSINNINISPSLALGFYFRTPWDSRIFFNMLENLSKKYEEDFFLGLERNSGEYEDFKFSSYQVKERTLSGSWEIIG